MQSKAPKFRHWTLFLLLGTAASAAIATRPAVGAGGGGDPAFEDIASLEAAAQSAAMAALPPLCDRQRFITGPIQPGLQLTHCAGAVRPVIGAGQHMKDRVTVELRCANPAWHLYVPVRVVGTTPVAVTAHAIVMGSVLSASDLRVEQRDLSELPPGFFDDPATVVGLTAARPISGGAIVTNQQLVASKAVQRGQAVTLVANTGGMQVRMAGRALTDGLVNQRVKVQNLSSGKVVEGIARSEQVVEIIFE
jgi:flagella basal body P-ring formation protein FlgA